jgi:beta-phosphoglucomutase family hydrolase
VSRRPRDIRLRVPAAIRCCLFDLDGVLTASVELHRAAWTELFDAFLAAHGGGTFTEADYHAHVDGRLREDGVRAFLAARGIRLPEPEVRALADAKNARVLEAIAQDGVDAYADAVCFVDAVRAAGLRCAVVSSSANCGPVLEGAGIAARFEVRVDGLDVERLRLAGKPAPDLFLTAVAELGERPAAAAVFEDAVAGVEAGRAGRFGWVVGVDRAGTRGDALRAAGADVVVGELTELLAEPQSARAGRRRDGAPPS